jgi:hypothetical protein
MKIGDKGEFFLKEYFVNQPIAFSYAGQVIRLMANEDNLSKFEKLKIDANTVSETGILRIETGSDNEQKRLLACWPTYKN